MASATSAEKASGGVMGSRWLMWRAAAASAARERGFGVEAVGAGGEVGGDEDVAGAGDAGRADRGRGEGDGAGRAGGGGGVARRR